MKPTSRSVFAPRLRAAILALGLASAQLAGTTAAVAQPAGKGAAGAADNTKKALDLFKKAQGLYKANKFAEALPLFRESWGLQPSPNSQIYIARCLASTGDHVGAWLEYTSVIAEVDRRNDPKYQPAKDSATTEREEAAAKIGLLTVDVRNPTADTRLTVAGRDIARDAWGQPIPLPAGAVDVTVTTPPAAPKPQSVTLKPGDKQQISVDAAVAQGPAVETPKPGGGSSRAILRPISYVAAGVGVAGFVMFGVAGGLATAAYSELDSKCSKASSGTRVCDSKYQSQIDSGKLDQTLANTGLIVGAVGLAAGVTLFLLSREPKKEAAPQPQVNAIVSPSYLGVQGTF